MDSRYYYLLKLISIKPAEFLADADDIQYLKSNSYIDNNLEITTTGKYAIQDNEKSPLQNFVDAFNK